jgi:hypothetical protein
MVSSVTRDSAEMIALKGLGFLAQSDDGLNRFLSQTGLEPDSLRKLASQPEFLAAVTDFLLSDDSLISAFCNAESLKPEVLHSVRRALPGG